ncbi:deoxyribose-phosphate aldolase [Streptomyces sp. NPDC052396]|uniref:Cgl0159 family (beta/alpha)8-fold protein n=1 Tax=Streptomyces sp. NPDC052396 TaxID=3365689 RepID=UPI0037D084FF
MSIAIADLTTVRSRHPEAIAEAAARRARRPLLGEHGRLLVIAADHPARGALEVGGRGPVMADRAGLLERLCLALSRPGVDGVLASADILDDLLLLGALEHKVVMGSMNRGGLRGASFELDDRFTGPGPEDLARRGFDAGKLLLRLDYQDPGSLRTLESAARVVDAMAARRLPLFIEPFLCTSSDGRLRSELGAQAVATSLAIASGLGASSAYTWLKVPVTADPADLERALRATTLPVVLLGGDEEEGVYERWRTGLRLPGVRGLVAGRALLYPADGDVAGAVDRAVALLLSPFGV